MNDDLKQTPVPAIPAQPGIDTVAIPLVSSEELLARAAQHAPPKDEGRDAALVHRSVAEIRADLASGGGLGRTDRLMKELDRALAAHPANVAPAGELSDAQIVAAWQSMPGGPDGWLKSFGFLQFARAVLAAAKKRGTGITASVLEQAAQACDQHADGTNGPHRSACLQCANAVRALRDATVDAGDQAAAATNQETPP